MLPEAVSVQLYRCLLLISQASGAIMIMMALVWNIAYGESSLGVPFSRHPLTMCCAIFILGDGILVFRFLRDFDLSLVKIIHIVMLVFGIILMIAATVFVYRTYEAILDDEPRGANGNWTPTPLPFLGYSSFHTWIGAFTVIMYILELVAGFITFYYSGLRGDSRRLAVAYHQLIGMGVFCGAIVTACFGISQRASWRSICYRESNYGLHAISNVLATTLLLYCVTVVLLVCNPRWSRELVVRPIETARSTVLPFDVEDEITARGPHEPVDIAEEDHRGSAEMPKKAGDGQGSTETHHRGSAELPKKSGDSQSSPEAHRRGSAEVLKKGGDGQGSAEMHLPVQGGNAKGSAELPNKAGVVQGREETYLPITAGTIQSSAELPKKVAGIQGSTESTLPSKEGVVNNGPESHLPMKEGNTAGSGESVLPSNGDSRIPLQLKRDLASEKARKQRKVQSVGATQHSLQTSFPRKKKGDSQRSRKSFVPKRTQDSKMESSSNGNNSNHNDAKGYRARSVNETQNMEGDDA
ncbi:unnamed protein product [Nippostrongylus brasiliensis]|uniref:Putative cytochrome B561 (inferred by orthology to a S. mansoni protein) n=1 Tax=Nippostrongylus brasiliensis TaxID=27835 RepID=A0A158R1U6_NIPBR|nr:unnamed protein product [Nippostrongylus brasiliensis]